MITIRFTGGLGNQLFQYATARALAERHGTEVLGDLADYGVRFPVGSRRPKRPDRPFDLARLAPGRLKYAAGWAGYLAHRRAKPDWPKWLSLFGPTYVEPHAARFDPVVLDLPDGTALVGYFQSERYFSAIAGSLRRELRPADPMLSARVAAKVGALRRPGRELVSVHVRRGDYLEYDGLVIEAERIRAAMARFPGSDFLVFSDDMAWCREALGGENVEFSGFQDALEDFYAMGLCDHHVIANSTFSWWAVWLATRGDTRRILAPTDWHGRYPERWAGDEDIYAAGWERY